MPKKKVVIGLSGGVDSSVAAALLIEQGYEVEAVYLECYNEPGCRTDQDKADALKVAMKLGIRFQVLDFRKEYKEKVVEYFYHEYEAGRTPNPDVMCNREIKFGIFYDYAIEQGYDYVATGHYARIVESCKVRPSLRKDLTLGLQRAKDENKDQSYFLWQIPRDHLKHILFPLGGMLKSEVRAKAKQLDLPTASKPDSMGICFIGEVDVNRLLRERLGEKPGEVIFHGEVVGTHRGLWFYTIGSRGGWEMDPQYQKSDMEPLYVIGKDKEKNQLIVGTREETMRNQWSIVNGQWLMDNSQQLYVRIRNLGELVAVTKCNRDTVTLSKPIFGVASGQSAVFYDERGVLAGGGIIV